MKQIARNLSDAGEGFLRNARHLIHDRDSLLSNMEKNHQGLDNRLIERWRGQPPDGGRVARRERLGGVLNFYYREAA